MKPGGEYDPLGVLAPSAPGVVINNNPPYSSGSLHSPDMGCMVDGLPTSCDLANRLIGSGTGVPCHNNDCGPRRFATEGGDTITQPYGCFADGYCDYLPAGLQYVGEGVYRAADDTGGMDTFGPGDVQGLSPINFFAGAGQGDGDRRRRRRRRRPPISSSGNLNSATNSSVLIRPGANSNSATNVPLVPLTRAPVRATAISIGQPLTKGRAGYSRAA